MTELTIEAYYQYDGPCPVQPLAQQSKTWIAPIRDWPHIAIQEHKTKTDRLILFDIIVKSHPDCSCTHKQRRLPAVQYLGYKRERPLGPVTKITRRMFDLDPTYVWPKDPRALLDIVREETGF